MCRTTNSNISISLRNNSESNKAGIYEILFLSLCFCTFLGVNQSANNKIVQALLVMLLIGLMSLLTTLLVCLRRKYRRKKENVSASFCSHRRLVTTHLRSHRSLQLSNPVRLSQNNEVAIMNMNAAQVIHIHLCDVMVPCKWRVWRVLWCYERRHFCTAN